MTPRSLQALIGTALTDASFCHALLNGSRRKVLTTFHLTRDEVELIMNIRADSLEQFAGALHNCFLAPDVELEPLPPVRRTALTVPRASRAESPVLPLD